MCDVSLRLLIVINKKHTHHRLELLKVSLVVVRPKQPGSRSSKGEWDKFCMNCMV